MLALNIFYKRNLDKKGIIKVLNDVHKLTIVCVRVCKYIYRYEFVQLEHCDKRIKSAKNENIKMTELWSNYICT